MTALTDTEIAAWARLLRAGQSLTAAVEADLKAAGLPPLAWYDALLELDRAGPDGLRPAALQQAMLLAQYNLSRLLDRMERAGLVARTPCPEDARGQLVTLTGKGRSELRRIWPVYRAGVARHFADRLGRGEAESLARILDPLGGSAATCSASSPRRSPR